MSVIADFAAYPSWAGLHSAEVLGEPGPDGRAQRVRLGLAAGFIKDSFVLDYRWQDDEEVRWDLAEPGSVISTMLGSTRGSQGTPHGPGSANSRCMSIARWTAPCPRSRSAMVSACAGQA